MVAKFINISHLFKYAIVKIWLLTCYIIAACFPIEPLEKCATFKDIFPQLSKTKVIFEDFPGPGIIGQKIQDFPGGVRTLANELGLGK